MSRETELQRLVTNAIIALDKLVVYRDDHPETQDLPDHIQQAFCYVEIADSALSKIIEEV